MSSSTTGGGMPWAQARRVGDRGEELAVLHLAAQGWTTIDRGWRCRDGELDIVAESRDGDLLFCEVKTRRSTRFGLPVEAVTPDKARRLRVLAWAWLREHGRAGESFRIDVIGILLLGRQEPTVQHLQGVA